MATHILGSCVLSNATNSLTFYGAFSQSDGFAASANNLAVQVTNRNAGVLSNFRAFARTNGRTSDTVVTFRKNNAASATSVSITAATTGSFEDTVNTESLSDGDEYNVEVVFGAGTANTLNITVVDGLFTPTSGHKVQMSTQRSNASFSQGNTTAQYLRCVGSAQGGTPSSGALVTVPVAGTLSNMQANIIANTRNGAVNMVSYINAGTGNQSLSVTSSTTGIFEDTSNTDSISSLDDFGIRSTAAGTSGSCSTMISGMALETTDPGFCLFITNNGAVSTGGVSITSDTFWGLMASNSFAGAETSARWAFPMDAVLSKMVVDITANTAGSSKVVTLRKNGSNANQSITAASATTGEFQDTTNTDSVSKGDFLAYQLTRNGQNFSIRDIAIFVEEVSGGIVSGAGSTAGSSTVSGVGESTFAGAGAASGTGTYTGIGASTAATSGASAGAGTDTGEGTGVLGAAGLSSGTGTPTGTGAATASGSGTADGDGDATGAAASTTAASGAAAGQGTPTGTGAAIAAATGQSDGDGDATGAAASTAASAGASVGTGTPSGTGAATAAGQGESDGVSNVDGVSNAGAISAGAGYAAGTSTCIGISDNAVTSIITAHGIRRRKKDVLNMFLGQDPEHKKHLQQREQQRKRNNALIVMMH